MGQEGMRGRIGIIHTDLQVYIIPNLSYLFWHIALYKYWLCCFRPASDLFHLSFGNLILALALECTHMRKHIPPSLSLMVAWLQEQM